MRAHPSTFLRDWGLADPPDRNAVVLAYRRRAQRLHPDRAGNTPAANADFVALREQYGLLLAYSANPGSFGPAGGPGSASSSEPPANPPPPVAPTRAGWRIPPADLTLLLWWPLGSVWAGGPAKLSFLRGVPCGCGQGCSRCHGTAVLLERVQVQVQVPPLPTRAHRVRLVGVGHRGDQGTAGDVWLEVAWRAWGRWRWQDGVLFQSVDYVDGAPWLYVEPPGGGVARLPVAGGLFWTSPAGLVAKVQARSVSRWSWGRWVQGWRAWRWALRQPGPLGVRLGAGWVAARECAPFPVRS